MVQGSFNGIDAKESEERVMLEKRNRYYCFRLGTTILPIFQRMLTPVNISDTKDKLAEM